MKKFFKIIFILLVILIALFIINFCRNYFILKRIYDLGNNFKATENYHIQKNINTSFGKEFINYYYKDKKSLYIDEEDGDSRKYNTIGFYNKDTDEYIEFTSDDNGQLIKNENPTKNAKSDFIEDFIYCKSYDFSDLLKKNIFKIIKEDKENYIINLNNQNEYVNKETGLLDKVISQKNNIEIEVIFEKGVVDDKMIDINQYNIQH